MKFRLLLPICLLLNCLSAVFCYAIDVSFQWDPNSEADLAGYKIYYKQDSPDFPFNGIGADQGASPINVGNRTTTTLTGLDPGLTYYFTVTAYNIDGYESYFSNIVTVFESIPPTLTISPVTSPTSLTNQKLSGTVSDNQSVASVTVKVSSGTAGSATINGTTWSFTLSDLTVGTNSIVVTAQDTAGNTSTVLATIVVVDLTPPTITINPVTSPTNQTGQTLNGTVKDNIGVASVVVKTASGPAAPATITGTAWSYQLSGLVAGSNTITVSAQDTAGNSSTALTTIVVDLTPPTIIINPVTSPTNQTGQNLSGTVSDNLATASVMVKAGSGAAAAATITGNTWSYALTGLTAGTNIIAITALDSAGNSSTASATVVVDLAPPTVTINPVTSPSSQTSQNLSGTVNDNIGVASVTVKLGSGTPAPATISGGTWSFALSGLLIGTNSITVAAQDTAGNISTASATIVVDQTPSITPTPPPVQPPPSVQPPSATQPPPTIAINPITSPIILTFQTLTGTVTSNLPGTTVKVTVGSAAPASATITGTNWAFAVTNLIVGNNSIIVTATDSVGNIASASTSITRVNVGAANSDGVVTVNDALLSLNYVLGLVIPTPEQFIRSDVAPIDMTTHQPKPDGKLDIDDVLVMLRRAVGLPW